MVYYVGYTSVFCIYLQLKKYIYFEYIDFFIKAVLTFFHLNMLVVLGTSFGNTLDLKYFH